MCINLYQLSAITELCLDLCFLLSHPFIDNLAKGTRSCLPIWLHEHSHLQQNG